jgi:RND family efflux transporter MFP subunit
MKISQWIMIGWGLLAAACNPDSVTNRTHPPVQTQPIAARADSRSTAVHRQSDVVRAKAPDRYTAVIAPVKGVDLAPHVIGELRALYVDAGDHVQRGALIAEIDPRRLQEELTIAEQVLHTSRMAQRQANIDVAYAKRVFANEERAVARGVSAKQNLEKARFDVERARAAYARAQATMTEQETRVNQFRNRLHDAQIRAPFSGVISVRYRDSGATLDPDSPVVRLISNDALRVRFAVPLSHRQHLQPGQAITVDTAQTNERMHGVICQIAPELDPASELIFIEAELTTPRPYPLAVYPGTAAWVSIPHDVTNASLPLADHSCPS